MSAQAASKIASQASKAAFKADGHLLNKGAKRDPELYILMGIMSGAFGLAGYYLGSKPTSATSETKVNVAAGGMPWQGEGSKANAGEDFSKYKYHPQGDSKNPPREAPSALHSVIIPNVNLPKELHEKYNKWGKEGY
ncbi:hypothetical protein M430DRAFT_44328 [Amorphotheca resinae ATCC 22711]|uniref:Uncharacterized protein n=1 Tax=Amorphotheca resinae ATCC 22711 TaxID=857342 RepID=A0A2T3AUQ6_AMORE|nr:hypothetical protein M430DRAFT_44328 [Amorphotheca resinae ATCC 22711]PSS12396.1 hypothetical protein M430DRAFT_44328 [Amorphotheca resinae ATCC 22711]